MAELARLTKAGMGCHVQMISHAEVRHALSVRRAVYTDDFAAFFRLYAGTSLLLPPQLLCLATDVL